MKFELTLKNSKLKSYHLIGWILIFFNLVLLLYFSFERSEQDRYLAFGLFPASILVTAMAWTDKVRFMSRIAYAGILYILIAALWAKWRFSWAIAADALFFILYTYSVRKFEVSISGEKIIYPSFPRKEIMWNELQNIILKDGILTIDFKNNKLLQNEVADDENIDEKKINEFCREQLTK